MPSVIDQIRKLDEQKAKLLQDAKKEALGRAEAAIADLNSLGFNYRLVEGSTSSRGSPAEGSRKGTRQVNAERPCPICNFRTEPPHDARRHRGQHEKRPFTAEELKGLGLRRV